MTAALLIDPIAGAGWLADAGAGSPWQPGAVLPAQHRVIAVVPGESVAIHAANVPARRAAELRQAVPYVLEERLSAPVETLHFAIGERDGDSTPVAVVARNTLQDWLARLGRFGLNPDRCVADAHLLPREGEILHAARVDDRLLLADGQGAWVLPANDWPQWRSLFGGRTLRALSARGGFVDTDGLPEALDRAAFLRLMAPHAEAVSTIDLLEGEFAPVRKRAGERRQWRWLAVLAGLAVVLAFADAAIGFLGERQRRDDLREQMAQIFRQALPEARMTADPAAQLVAELGRSNAGAGASGLFDLLRRVAPAIAQGSRYRLQAIDYRLGALELEIATADVASLDALRETLASQGLGVELTGVDPGDDGVRGRLRLSGGGA